MAEIYFIGGSPCSGKSTIAEALSNRYDMHYFKVDDYLEKYMNQGAMLNYELCKKQTEWNVEQIWMREPELQCEEEIKIYEEIFGLVMQDLETIQNSRNIITEGAAYMPHLMKRMRIPNNRYIAITPTNEFQISHYKEREWVDYVLKDCSDKEKAFDNWMIRDNLFAENVNAKCRKEEYMLIINNGQKTAEKLISEVSRHFELDK